MCKQQTVYFTCGHNTHIRESTCNFRKNITAIDGSSAWRACQSSSYMSRRMSVPCKRCYYESQRIEIQLMAEDLRCGTIDHLPELAHLANADLDEIDEWEASCIEELMKTIPRFDANRKSRHLNTPTWNSCHTSKRTTSLLSIEVKPEDVVGHWDWETTINNDAVVADTPSTGAWDSDDDEGWARPGEQTMICEDYGEDMNDEPQEDVSDHYDTSADFNDVKQDVQSDYFDSSIDINDAKQEADGVLVLTGSTWGCLSIL